MSEYVDNRSKNSKTYKLVDQNNQYYYIGSTACATLSKRFSWHKQDAKKKHMQNSKKYLYFNSIGWEIVKLILIDEFNFDKKIQLLKEEDKLIQQYINDPKCLNAMRSIIPDIEKKEYNKEHHIKYWNANVEKIRCKDRERSKLRNMDKCICECGIIYAKHRKQAHEQKEHHKTYFKNLKTDCPIGYIQCECGIQIKKRSMYFHKNTKIHQTIMNNK